MQSVRHDCPQDHNYFPTIEKVNLSQILGDGGGKHLPWTQMEINNSTQTTSEILSTIQVKKLSLPIAFVLSYLLLFALRLRLRFTQQSRFRKDQIYCQSITRFSVCIIWSCQIARSRTRDYHFTKSSLYKSA